MVDPEVDKLINIALNKAVRASGPVKLYNGKTGEDGLFAEKTGSSRKAALFGLATSPALWSEEPRTSLNQPLLVRLQRGGLERLVESTKSAMRKRLIDESSELYRLELLEQWSDMAAAGGWEDEFSVIGECCFRLMGGIEKLVPQGVSAPAKAAEAVNGDAADFKRRTAHELVIAWKYAPSEETKQSLANALKNSGIQQIGEPKELISMDGGLHRCDGPAFPGDKVEVVESGWLVHDGVGEFLLEKAIVKLI